MKAEIELSSISMSKNDPKISKLDKYDVEVNIEEIDNSEDQSIFKYGFTALSNPKNVRLSIEGTAKIVGDSMERDEILTKDENDVPKILTMIYHELFPTFFLLSKNLNVSCPPHTIGSMFSGESIDDKVTEKSDIESENAIDDTSESNTESEEIITSSTDVSPEKEENPDITQPTV